MLEEKGIEFYHINRGGDITFHGPRAIGGLSYFDLDNYKTDLGWYLRSLEEVIILTIAAYGLKGERSAVKPVFGWMRALREEKEKFVPWASVAAAG